MNEHTILIENEKCIGCGLCARDCPAGNIVIADKKAVVKSQDCIKCAHCAAICPQAAVTLTGFDEPPEEIEKPARLPPSLLLEALKTRRTIRFFKNKPVESGVIADIIEAGRFTPSGKNAQDVSYIVLQNGLKEAEKRAVSLFRRMLPFAKLVEPMARNRTIDDHFFFKKAPAAIVVLSNDPINGSLAAANMSLMAEAHGLGVLYSGFFSLAVNHSGALRRLLGVKGLKAVTTLVIGYPDVTYRRTAQKERALIRYY